MVNLWFTYCNVLLYINYVCIFLSWLFFLYSLNQCYYWPALYYCSLYLVDQNVQKMPALSQEYDICCFVHSVCWFVTFDFYSMLELLSLFFYYLSVWFFFKYISTCDYLDCIRLSADRHATMPTWNGKHINLIKCEKVALYYPFVNKCSYVLQNSSNVSLHTISNQPGDVETSSSSNGSEHKPYTISTM